MTHSKYIFVVTAALWLAACATTPKEDPTFTRAQAQVQAASSDSAIMQYAPQELQRAQQEIDAAQKATSHEELEQHAYLASRHVELARQEAREAVARAAISQGQEERTRIQLAARTAEAQRAQRAAEEARAQAATANVQAAQAQGQAEQLKNQAAQLQAQAAQLQKELQDLQAKQTDRGIVVTLRDVLFDTGKTELKPGADLQLNKIANFLQQHPERHVAIEGFTDSVGGAEYNQQLSERRAQAVKEALAGMGIAADRIDTRGYGKGYPVASNSEATGRQLNRRVEIVISTGENAVPPRNDASAVSQ